jgi:tetrahydromethanopterin S-methyltransferase subunit G
MIASIPSDLADVAMYKLRLSEKAEKVKKEISQRMRKKTAGILCAVCLGLYLICFMPFLFGNVGTTQMLLTAVLLSAAMCGVLGIVMLVSLFFLRRPVVNAVNDYNSTARAIMDDIEVSMQRFSTYLSILCNVRRGRAVQNYAEKNLDEYTRGLRIRKKHQEDIRKIRAQLLEGYAAYFGDRSCCDETMCRPYEYDFDQAMEYAYPVPFLAGDRRQIEFISSGNLVTVPSSYITRVWVRMEGIYEK